MSLPKRDRKDRSVSGKVFPQKRFVDAIAVALRREYAVDLQNRPTIQQLLDEVIDALGRAAVLKPFVVLDGSPSGLRANHRRNLDGYIVDARQRMYSIREELEK